MKKTLNKWQIGMSLVKDYRSMEMGWKIFNFYFINLKSIPDQGEMLHKRNYKGFIIKFAVWIPFDKAY